MPQRHFRYKGTGDLIAGISGGLVFLLFYLAIGFPILIALVIAGASFFGVSLLLGSMGKKVEFQEVDGFTPETIAAIIDESTDQLNAIRGYAAKITNVSVKAKITELCELIAKIIDNVSKAPKGVKVIRKFLSYYLEATTKIVRQYVELTETAIQTPEIHATLQRAEQMLDLIKTAFTKQMAKLLENDVLDLDTEMSVLESTLKSEGLL